MMGRLLSRFKRPTPEITPAIVGAREVGWASNPIFRDMPKYNPDELIGRKGHRIYRQMMLDEQVKAVVRFKRDAITGREFELVMPQISGKTSEPGSEDNTRIEIYDEMIRQSFGSFVDGLNYVLMAMYQGFSMTEKIIDTFEFNGRPYLGLKELIPKPYDTFEFHVDDFGSIEKTIQRVNAREQVIDLDRFVYYVQNPEFDQHYGQSDLREAYRSYYSKDIILRYYNIFLERFAGGFAVASPKSGTAITPGSPEHNSIIAILDSLQTQSSVLIPNNVEIEVQTPTTTDQFESAIRMHDLGIAKALLVPNLLGITPQAAKGGGFAQADTQVEAFLWTLDADAKRLTETINEQVFAPLSKLNFPDGRGPMMRFKEVSERKKLEIVTKWTELVTAGAVEASDTDEHHVRKQLNFPEKGEPLNITPEVGEPGSIPPESRSRGPVKEPNQQRTTNIDARGLDPDRILVPKAVFARAEKRVSFNVIERKANVIENDGVITIESKTAEMVADLVARIEGEKWGTPAAGIAGIDKIDFNPRQKTKVRKAMDNVLNQAWALGIKHSKVELASARKERFKINMERIAEDAADFLRVNGFRMLGNLSDAMRASVQTVLVNGVKFSWTTEEIVRKVYDVLVKEGFLSIETNAAATARNTAELLEILGVAEGMHRLKTAVRTNVFEAINEARFSTFTDPDLDGFVEALEYSAILDSRTTRVCRHLDDRLYAIDSPVWNKWRPPNHFNCRSILVPVTVIDTDVEGKDSPGDSRFSRTPTIQPQAGFGA